MLRRNTHWLVLAGALIVAVAAWMTWLYVGAAWVHSQAIPGATPAAASPPLASNRIGESTEREKLFSERGQVGDSFGGLNALLTAVAGALVFWAGYMQHQLLKKTRETADSERTHREVQQFESLFFRLLELCAEVTDRIEGRKRAGKVVEIVPGGTNVREQLIGPSGPRALNAYANVVFHKFYPPLDKNPLAMAGLKSMVGSFLTRVYDRQPSGFGPYYRILYQTFKHVADSNLTDAEQVRYANIARGQISEGAVLLLALNGLTYDGYKFIPLIEKFGLLEHLHRRYRQTCEPYLLLGYRSRAFMGSVERSLPENAWCPTPILPLEHSLHAEQDRANADQETDFHAGFNGEESIDE